ncbi:FtsX-like permease family protein [Fervidibacillus albus]|uniref:ABC transporter permease n=1 Tax=Fervidibacillus albus TaxID=2980026 RepID=A0A9E8RU88_9BACI|nr:ABC transporter permease [Fervidibacillus albus]WAA09060.1 ABC transporter permease [Fervidibacillus albus]
MEIKHFIWKNVTKNVKNYYLYVFALMMSVALYFSFVTLQYDPALNEIEGTVKGAAAIKTSSVLLIAIIATFLLYANLIFIKRRGNEIGLLHLIGLTKNKIFRILTAENLILYFGSFFAGVFIGFSLSKLISMILFKLIGIDAVAKLHFSTQAFIQTTVVFFFIYLFIMTMNFIFVKRQTILALFQVKSIAEEKVKKPSFFQWIIGIFGLALIIIGYYVSSKLFDGDFTTINELYMAMLFILGSVIIGTYLFYKGSITIIFNLIRKKKNGYLSIKEVLSISPIMFRMKSNAFLLTVITTVSALAIGFMSLSYISYYSIGITAEENLPDDFGFGTRDNFEKFQKALDEQGIAYTEKRMEGTKVEMNIEQISESTMKELKMDFENYPIVVISDESLSDLDVSDDELVFSDYSSIFQNFFSFKSSGIVEINGKPYELIGNYEDSILPYYLQSGGNPTAIVDDAKWQQIEGTTVLYYGINIENKEELKKANDLFHSIDFEGNHTHSQLDYIQDRKLLMGLMMFIVGFLGLTFLIVSGSILYFKQMDESEDEKADYTILRKLGFSEQNLMSGIRVKQLFNFGIPLSVGLLHSYFAVKSGWFLFGTEMWTPMIAVMIFYTALYSIFGILSIYHYKHVIQRAL